MPTYKITDPNTGQTLKLTGPSPPSEAEIAFSFAQMSQEQAPPEPQAQPEGDWRQTVAGMARPALEFGGMLAGGAIAAPFGGPAAPVTAAAGGALGYGAGSQAADLLESALGVQGRQDPQVTQNAIINALAQAGQDVGQGAMMEMGGAALSKAVPLAVKGVKSATPQAIKTIPNRLYQSAAKFSTTIPVKERVAMADLAIKEKIAPTIKGWEKATNKITALNDKIVSVIDDSVATGEKIDRGKLFKHFDDLRAEAKLSGVPKSNLAAINNIEKQIKSAGHIKYTPQQAQKLKQNIYKDVNTAFGKISVPYRVDAQKAVARAAKEELEGLYPILKGLNAKEGALINLRKSIEAAANRITNRDILGIGIPIKGAAGATAGPAGAAAGIAQGILDAPRVKSALAMALSKAGQIEGKVPLTAARGAAYLANQGESQ
jgi:hypothetical protein